MSFKWINYEKPFLIKLKSKDSFFTKAFSLENIGEFNLNLKTLVQNVIVKISVIENLGTTIVYIQDLLHTISNSKHGYIKALTLDKTKVVPCIVLL